jgi:hypothetical protein
MTWELTMKFVRWILPIVMIVSPPTKAGATANIPTTQEIETDFDAKNYLDAIKKISIAISHGSDKATLFPIKAESHFQLKQFIAAADAFDFAAKQANDPNDIANYKTMAVLIRKSTVGKYQPRQPTTRPVDVGAKKPAPIDILDSTQRGDALNALFNDGAKVAQSKVDALLKQTGLSELMDGVKLTNDLRSIEWAATRNDVSSKKMNAALFKHADELMDSGIKSLTNMVKDTENRANQIIEYRTDYDLILRAKRGLRPDDKNILSSVIVTANYIAAACDQFPYPFDSSAGPFDKIKGRANAIASHANDVLHANYGS